MSKILWTAFRVSLAVTTAHVLVSPRLASAAEFPGATSLATSAEQLVLSGTQDTGAQPVSAAVAPPVVAVQPVVQLAASPTRSLVQDSSELIVPEQQAVPQSLRIQSVAQFAQADLAPLSTDPLEQVPGVSELSTGTTIQDQVTSVSQLGDVQPTDWAFQALQSLVERYGCIAGYPDRSYRGNRAMTRFEFAAGLNACLDRVSELIAAGTADLVTKQDLATLQRLQEEFAAELATLRGRVDALEARTATLEAQQFSTTTKLSGEVIVNIADLFGEPAGSNVNTVLQNRVRLNFDTSFTGKDRLRTRLQSRNATRFTPGGTYGFDAQYRLAANGPGGQGNPFNDRIGGFSLWKLEYRFPATDRLELVIEASNATDPTDIVDPITLYFADAGQGAVSNFAQVNPIYGTVDNGGGAGGTYKFSDAVQLGFGYLAESVQGDPGTLTGSSQAIGAINNPGASSGLFNGGYTAFAQLTIRPSDAIAIGLTYTNSYSPRGGMFTTAGSDRSYVNPINLTTGIPLPVVGNSYGAQFSFQVTPGLAIQGWAGYTAARAIGLGDGDVWNFMVGAAFPDLGKKGNLGGILFGVQPKLTGTSNQALADGIDAFSSSPRPCGNGSNRADCDTGFHVEAFYRYQLTDNISITPGVYWLTAPNHDTRNGGIVVGTIRTTFSF